MKQKTTQQSEPPAVAGGLTQSSANDGEPAPTSEAGENTAQLQPPATAGGIDLARLAAENEQLRTQLRTEQAHRQITGELATAGARSPELLFDAIKGELQFDDEGGLANAAAIVGRLKAAHPEQFGFERPAGIDGGAGRAAMPPLTREALARMKPAEIAALDWNEVKRALAG